MPASTACLRIRSTVGRPTSRPGLSGRGAALVETLHRGVERLAWASPRPGSSEGQEAQDAPREAVHLPDHHGVEPLSWEASRSRQPPRSWGLCGWRSRRRRRRPRRLPAAGCGVPLGHLDLAGDGARLLVANGDADVHGAAAGGALCSLGHLRVIPCSYRSAHEQPRRHCTPATIDGSPT